MATASAARLPLEYGGKQSADARPKPALPPPARKFQLNRSQEFSGNLLKHPVTTLTFFWKGRCDKNSA